MSQFGIMMGAILVSFAISILSVYLGHLVRIRTRWKLETREAELATSYRENGVKKVVLRYPQWAWKGAAALLLIPVFYMFCLAIILIGAYAGEIESSSNQVVIVGIACLTAATFAFPWAFFVSVVMVAHEVGPAGLKKVSPWSRGFSSSWDEIRYVSYGSWIDSYVVHTSKGTIRVRAILEGISYFIEMITEHVPQQKRDLPPRLYPGLESRQR